MDEIQRKRKTKGMQLQKLGKLGRYCYNLVRMFLSIFCRGCSLTGSLNTEKPLAARSMDYH